MTDADALSPAASRQTALDAVLVADGDYTSTGPRLLKATSRLAAPTVPPSLSPLPSGNGRGNVNIPSPDDDPLGGRADSEAETIIQSPEKKKKLLQHKNFHNDVLQNRDGPVAIDPVSMDVSPPSNTRKRKRFALDPHEGARFPSGQPNPRLERSKGPSSPTVVWGKAERKIRSPTDHDEVAAQLAQPNEVNERPRKRSASEGVLENGQNYRNGRMRRLASPEAPPAKQRKETNGAPIDRRISDDVRSISPSPHAAHWRASSSSQSSPTDNPSPTTTTKKKQKRILSPLWMLGSPRHNSEDRQSVSSSASSRGSPMPSAQIRKLASVDGTSTSPARQMATTHKKQRDQNGRTRLARACAAQEVESAMARHAERPEDLNVADNAENTPLQIASLEGCAPIVKFLLAAGCEIDTRNIDKDTPLIDAVENGHLEVVKLLLEAGANPRMVNAEGDEPYELVPSDIEDYEEIRRVLAEAKANPNSKRRPDDQNFPPTPQLKGDAPSRGASAVSPRDSPPIHGRSPPPMVATAGRRRTVRSDPTRNDLLWTKATRENLREFAAKGDMAGVAAILNVGQKPDTESLIAATKGGHEGVMQLLLGIGYADPDPPPLQSGNQRPGYNTPMLAAIGRGNLAVIRLLLAQHGFDPTRPFRNRTYYELARDRKGDHWEEELAMLKEAYDEYLRVKKGGRELDPRSSPRPSRDKDKEGKRSIGRRSPSRSPQRIIRSPVSSRRPDPPSKEANPSRQKIRDLSSHGKEKTTVTAPRAKAPHLDDNRSEHSFATSDPDSCRIERSKSRGSTLERRQSDSATPARGDEPPRRRRLIAGRPPQDRDQRRPSLLSSDSLSGRDEIPKLSVIDRPPERRQRTHLDTPLTKNVLPSLKRSRSSVTPHRSRSRDTGHRTTGSGEVHKKKRRVRSEDHVPNSSRRTVKKGHDLSIELPASHCRRPRDRSITDTERAKPQKAEATTADEAIRVKEEHRRNEGRAINDIPLDTDHHDEMVDPTHATKHPDTTTAAQRKAGDTQRQEDESRKREEEERLAAERRAAAEAEQARIAKEAEEREQAACRAREKAEEEERKRKEAEQRRIKQAEEERQRRLEQELLRLARIRREQEEQEQRRRDALPNRLRVAANLVSSNDPRAKNHTWLKKFMPVVTARTQQLNPPCDLEVADDRWVPNYLVAPLLATNDLQLSQYSSWEKRNATPTQRNNLWRVTRRILAQADDSDFLSSTFGQVLQKDCETRPKYFEMEHVFWVRLSDFMDLVPHVPHLQGLDIELLSMHIDREPMVDQPIPELPQVNGHTSSAFHADHPAPTNGLPNGYGHARLSTYV